jgi:hypothetical protein
LKKWIKIIKREEENDQGNEDQQDNDDGEEESLGNEDEGDESGSDQE